MQEKRGLLGDLTSGQLTGQLLPSTCQGSPTSLTVNDAARHHDLSRLEKHNETATRRFASHQLTSYCAEMFLGR